MKKRIKVVQQLQQQKGLHYGEIDGIAGLVTVGGLARIAGINQQWPKTRQITVFIQMEVNDRGAGNPGRTGHRLMEAAKMQQLCCKCRATNISQKGGSIIEELTESLPIVLHNKR